MSGLAARGGWAVKPCAASVRTSPRSSANALAPQLARALAHSRSVGFTFARSQDRLVYSLPHTLTTQPDLVLATRAALATGWPDEAGDAARFALGAGARRAWAACGDAPPRGGERAMGAAKDWPLLDTTIDVEQLGHGYVQPCIAFAHLSA
jgi:hypothetical protein